MVSLALHELQYADRPASGRPGPIKFNHRWPHERGYKTLETEQMLSTTAQVTEMIDVLQTPDTVFDYVSDHENDPNWRKGVASMTHIPSGPAHKGMKTREEIVLWDRKRAIMAAITGYEAGRSIAFKTKAGGLQAHGEREVFATPRGASISYTVGAKLSGFPAFLVPLIKLGFRLRLRSNLDRLKQLLEADEQVRTSNESGYSYSKRHVPRAC